MIYHWPGGKAVEQQYEVTTPPLWAILTIGQASSLSIYEAVLISGTILCVNKYMYIYNRHLSTALVIGIKGLVWLGLCIQRPGLDQVPSIRVRFLGTVGFCLVNLKGSI